MQRKFKATMAGAACLLITNLSADVKRPALPATPGMLMSINPKGEPAGPCPLKHTDVKADISGFLSRVTVTQEFENPYQEKIEAGLHFPAAPKCGRRQHDHEDRRPHRARQNQTPRRSARHL